MRHRLRIILVMLRQVGLKGAIDSGKFNAQMLEWLVALMRYTPTMLNEIRATPRVITPIKGINKAMLFTDELLTRITSPVNCFWGENDPNGGAETARRFVARLPHGTLDLVPDAGHAPWIDAIERATESTRRILADSTIGQRTTQLRTARQRVRHACTVREWMTLTLRSVTEPTRSSSNSAGHHRSKKQQVHPA